MRNLFFALVLANLGFGAWSAWYAAEPTTAAQPPAGAPIRLVSEVEPERAEADDPGAADGLEASAGPAEADEPERPDAAVAASRCVSVGPFPDLADAAAASSRLRAAGFEPSQRVADGEIWVGYWVHLEGIPTRDEAGRILETLRGNGIGEAYLIPGEEDGHIISLGVFNDIGRAGRLREQVRRLDLEPAIVDRSRRGTVHWIDVELPPERDLAIEILQVPNRITRLEQRPCEAPD